ncbi:histidine phosphatase family protein [Brevibacillus migulae]|uniref:histidine phosphatase family protein n=1 Tax=Brevibacillus migulae TaxID=1644114 RepID=UPI00106DE095|nr:histidine phosphatase family protein [Brevibacillus migulae]
MKTWIYLIRHAESPFVLGEEEARGLSEKGRKDAKRVSEILLREGIDVVISSNYQRAIQTVQDLAESLGVAIRIQPDFRERTLAAQRITFDDFEEALRATFADPDFAHPGGESNREAAQRGVAALLRVLEEYPGKRIAIGIHGSLMTVIMGAFDPRYDFHFWKTTTMPDIYKLIFEEKQLLSVERLWEPLRS